MTSGGKSAPFAVKYVAAKLDLRSILIENVFDWGKCNLQSCGYENRLD